MTIIDDDEPGILSVAERHIKVRPKDQYAYIKINRTHGCDGVVTCNYETILPPGHKNQAVEGKDFDYHTGELVFENGEN